MNLPNSDWICQKCGKPLILKRTVLEYLGHTFAHELPCCPDCGQVLIPPELAEGKIQEVERLLEDK